MWHTAKRFLTSFLFRKCQQNVLWHIIHAMTSESLNRQASWTSCKLLEYQQCWEVLPRGRTRVSPTGPRSLGMGQRGSPLGAPATHRTGSQGVELGGVAYDRV